MVNVSKKGAAEELKDRTLLNDWHVQHRISYDEGMTGGSRSACYRAINSKGEFAFVKAFDFRREELEGDTESLEKMVREFNYEKNVHLFCRDQQLSRITKILGSGNIRVNEQVVHFLVCEWAEKCLREQQPPGDTDIAISERFIALKDTAAALAQLHQIGVAHQDIKPSNAVCTTHGTIKLTDLGSSSCKAVDAPPHDLDFLVGQPNYAPYELLYDEASTNWERRRFGCDLFLLGNLCFTTLVGQSLSIASLHLIPIGLRHTEFSGSYAEVIPHLIEAHELLIPAFIEGKVPEPILNEVVQLIASLCHPDTTKRGHSKNIIFNNNQFGLERFITRFDVLAKKAKVMEREKK